MVKQPKRLREYVRQRKQINTLQKALKIAGMFGMVHVPSSNPWGAPAMKDMCPKITFTN